MFFCFARRFVAKLLHAPNKPTAGDVPTLPGALRRFRGFLRHHKY
jgi:hypothetical protein